MTLRRSLSRSRRAPYHLALRAAVEDPDAVPNGPMPLAIGPCLEAGADRRRRTRIDDCETPREMAERMGLREIADRLAANEARLGP